MKKQWKWVAFIGVVGGLLQGLFGISGPMAIIVLTCSPIHIKRWKGNFYAWNLPSQIFVLLKMSLGSESLFEKDKIVYYFAMCSFAILGGLFGDFLSKLARSWKTFPPYKSIFSIKPSSTFNTSAFFSNRGNVTRRI